MTPIFHRTVVCLVHQSLIKHNLKGGGDLTWGVLTSRVCIYYSVHLQCICVRSRNCGCLVTWFCYQLIAKPGNKTAAVSWPDPYTIWGCVLIKATKGISAFNVTLVWCIHSLGLFHWCRYKGGGWGGEVSCGGHHRLRRKTTTGSALDGAVSEIAQILAYLVHNMSRSQLYLGFGHFGWLPSFFGQ